MTAWRRPPAILHGRPVPSRSGTRGPCGARGYTLLELLIVGVLLTVLMAGIWSLFRNWSGLYERGEQRVQRLQLVRSLCDQFTDDVRAASQVGAPPGDGRTPGPQHPAITPAGGDRSSAAAGNAALVGGTDWLMLEVVQASNPWQDQATESTPQDGSLTQDQSVLAAPECRRVVYTFAPPESDTGSSLSSIVAEMAAEDDTELVAGEETAEQPFAGLLRLAVAREAPLVSSAGMGSRSGSGSGASSATRDEAFRIRAGIVGGGGISSPPVETDASIAETSWGSNADADPLAGILGRDEVPEVVSFELRYYNGSSWQSSWDSSQEGRLPVAVEMRFELQVSEPDTRPPVSGDDTELVDDTRPVSTADTSMSGEPSMTAAATGYSSLSATGEPAETPYYRCVVFLQAAEKP